MVTTSTRASATTGWPCATPSMSACASRSAVPVVVMAPATGMSAASKVMTGQSMCSYTLRGGTVRSTSEASTPSANDTAAGSQPSAAPSTASAITPTASRALRGLGMCSSRSASGTHPRSAANAKIASAGPCISSRSPT